jgi:hypothetical protein
MIVPNKDKYIVVVQVLIGILVSLSFIPLFVFPVKFGKQPSQLSYLTVSSFKFKVCFIIPYLHQYFFFGAYCIK